MFCQKASIAKAKAVIGEVSKSQFLGSRINLKPEMVVKVYYHGIKMLATSADRMGSQPDVTRDLEYLELEKRYKEIVASADELRLETMAYRDHVASKMINTHSFVHSIANHTCRYAGPSVSLCQLSSRSVWSSYGGGRGGEPSG